MGAGMPVFRMASTIDPLWKKVRSPGNLAVNLVLHAIHIVEAADVVLFVQLHLNGGGIRPALVV